MVSWWYACMYVCMKAVFVVQVCGPAAANVSVDRYLEPFNAALQSHPCAVVTTGIRRGFLFYNQTAHSLIQWRKR